MLSTRTSVITGKGLHKNSQFVPTMNSPVIKTFIIVVKTGIHQLRHSEDLKHTRANLS